MSLSGINGRDVDEIFSFLQYSERVLVHTLNKNDRYLGVCALRWQPFICHKILQLLFLRNLMINLGGQRILDIVLPHRK